VKTLRVSHRETKVGDARVIVMIDADDNRMCIVAEPLG
jgi:hypothetical protein